jgi:hypothetical protein
MTARGPPSLPAHLISSKEHFHWGHNMKLQTSRLAVLIVVPLVILGSAAHAGATGPPLTATGSFTQVSFVPSNDRVAGGVLLFDFSEADVLTGDLSGTSVLEGSCVVRLSSGTGTCQAAETFTGTVDGHSGTAQFMNVFLVDLVTGAFSGRFTALGGTGGLINLQAQGTFEGTGATGTYSLQFTFAP